MAEALFEVGLGFSINGEVEVLKGSVDPSAGGGVEAPRGSIYLRDSGATGQLWNKTGTGDTAWEQQATATGTSTEDGYIQAFIGKSADGNEMPDYATENVVTDGNSLETAISSIDAEIGSAVTPETRTNFPTSDQAINLNIDVLDSAIGPDTDMLNQNYIAPSGTIYHNLSELDGQVKTNEDDITALTSGFRWIEKVSIVTGDDISAKSGTAVTFTDDDILPSGVPTLQVGDRIASTHASSNDNIYIVQAGAWTTVALVANDQFFTDYNLPNAVNYEGVSAYKYNGTDTVEVASFDFEAADSIEVATGYTPASGDPAAADTVQEALEKIDGNVDNINTLTGIGQSVTDLGTFTGTIISDNGTIKAGMQELESEIGVAVTGSNFISDQAVNLNLDALDAAIQEAGAVSTANNITTGTVIDSVLVDNYDVAIWEVFCEEAGTLTNKRKVRIQGMHNGTTGADATDVDWDRSAIMKLGNAIVGLTLSVTISGSGGSQAMNLFISSTNAVNIRAIRVTI